MGDDVSTVVQQVGDERCVVMCTVVGAIDTVITRCETDTCAYRYCVYRHWLARAHCTVGSVGNKFEFVVALLYC